MKKSIISICFLLLIGIVFTNCEEKKTNAIVPDSGNVEESKTKVLKLPGYLYAVGVNNNTSNGVQTSYRRKQEYNDPAFYTLNINFPNYLTLKTCFGGYETCIITGEYGGNSLTQYISVTNLNGMIPLGGGYAKYQGNNIVMEELEMFSPDLTKIFGVKGGRIFKLVFDGVNFNATPIITFPIMPASNYSIAHNISNNTSMRIYRAENWGSTTGNSYTKVFYATLDFTGALSTSWQVITPNLQLGSTVSSFTNKLSTSGKYYITGNSTIYEVNGSSLVSVSSFSNKVQDAGYYRY